MKKVNRNPDKPYEDMDGNWIGLWEKETPEDIIEYEKSITWKERRKLRSDFEKEEKTKGKTADKVHYEKIDEELDQKGFKKEIDKKFEDADGKWIGLWKGKDKWQEGQGFRYPLKGYNRVHNYSKFTDLELGEIEKLEKKCRDGDKEACVELEKLEKDNEDFLEHLMAIADHDEYPPKLKEPKE